MKNCITGKLCCSLLKNFWSIRGKTFLYSATCVSATYRQSWTMNKTVATLVACYVSICTQRSPCKVSGNRTRHSKSFCRIWSGWVNSGWLCVLTKKARSFKYGRTILKNRKWNKMVQNKIFLFRTEKTDQKCEHDAPKASDLTNNNIKFNLILNWPKLP